MLSRLSPKAGQHGRFWWKARPHECCPLCERPFFVETSTAIYPYENGVMKTQFSVEEEAYMLILILLKDASGSSCDYVGEIDNEDIATRIHQLVCLGSLALASWCMMMRILVMARIPCGFGGRWRLPGNVPLIRDGTFPIPRAYSVTQC